MNEELIKLTQNLLKIESTTGNEMGMANFVQGYLSQQGFTCKIDERNSVVATLNKGEGPTIMFDAHIDTVPADAEKWTHNPYGGEIADGKIFGRGASDMKGALGAMMYAAKTLAEDDSVQGTIILSGTAWEEYFEGYTLGKIVEGLEYKPDYVIIGEASELNLKRGQRGRTRVFVDVKGKASHSAHPDAGINAGYLAADLVVKIRDIKQREDDFLGRRIVELIGIHTKPQKVDSIVPDFCRLSYDLRLLTEDTEDSVLTEFRKIVAQVGIEAEVSIAYDTLVTTDGRVEEVKSCPPAWKLNEQHPLVQSSLKALTAIGLAPIITRYDFCTNGSYSAGIAGIPTIGFGPGKESTAHTVDEHITLDELEKASEGYVAIAKELMK